MIALQDQFQLRFYSIYWPDGVAVLIALRSYSIYSPEGVAVLIPHEHNLKLRSGSIYWPEGVAVLIYYAHVGVASRGGSLDPS